MNAPANDAPERSQVIGNLVSHIVIQGASPDGMRSPVQSQFRA